MKKMGQTINENKTKYIVVSSWGVREENWYIAFDRYTFDIIVEGLYNNNILCEIKMRILLTPRSYLSYASETWILSKYDMNIVTQ